MQNPDLTQVHDAVLSWAADELRDLPWRSRRDPWEILVAEVMSQQTQLQRVIPKWREFLARWPNPSACAAAPLAQVLQLWSGLGYPRRARALWETAKRITAEYGGEFPLEYEVLITLPGIGPYTANAVLCFAGEHDVGIVDTNIGRVLARTAATRLSARDAQRRAASLVPAGHGWVWNQALLDIGAQFCRPEPICAPCPLATQCKWHQLGHPHPDPAHKSAGVSTRQSAFAGSFRQERGVIMRLLETGPQSHQALLDASQLQSERLSNVVASLHADQLIHMRDDHYVLGWQSDEDELATTRIQAQHD